MATRNHEQQNANPKKFTKSSPTLLLPTRRHHMPKNVSNNLITGVEEQKDESPVTGGHPAQHVNNNLITGVEEQKDESFHNSTPAAGNCLSRMSNNLINKLQGPIMERNLPPLFPLNFPPVVHHPNARRSAKRAVLIGVSYKEWKFKLKGTVSDVKNIRDLLINRFGYAKEYIRVLTEEEPNPDFHPTKANILDSLRWLVDKNQPGDSLVFFYSGHGLQQYNLDRDEQDETICPSGFLKEGMIMDDELNSILVRPLIRGVKLHAIVNSCHSNTILDLPFIYDRKGKKWTCFKVPSGAYKGTHGGLAISISACTDNNQKASDTTAFTGKMNGDLTYILVQLLNTFPGPTYGELFDLMEEVIEDVNNGGNMFKKIMFSSPLSQTPLLSSSAEFDPYGTWIQL